MFSKKDLMNLESIVMLYAVKKHAGKIHAARRLSTSIDTLNKYLERLEGDLGTKLISINDRRCSLTVNGEKVAEVAEQIIGCLHKAYAVVSMEAEVKGEVRVAYDRNVRCNMYAKNLSKFLDTYPDISMVIDTFDMVPDLSDISYDLCLTYDIPKGDDLTIILARNVSCGFFASSAYLKTHHYPQNIDDLLDNHRLVLRNSWKINGTIKHLLQKAQKPPCISNSSFVVNDIIVNGGGVGIMPLSFTKDGLGLVCLDNIKCDAMLTVYLLSHKSVKDIPKVRVVLEYYKNLLQNL